MRTFATLSQVSEWRSLIILKGKYKQSTEKTIIESVNFFFWNLGVRNQAKQYKEYTKKSLILAQDER